MYHGLVLKLAFKKIETPESTRQAEIIQVYFLPQATPVATNSDVSDLIEEMNHDTITSLRNFVESAYYVKRASYQTQSNSTKSNSNDSINAGSKAASIHGDQTSTSNSSGWRRLLPRKLSLRSKSIILCILKTC